MCSRESTGSAARALLLRVVGNVAGQPGVDKFRSVKNTPGSKLSELVCSKPGGRDLMRAMGFVESSTPAADAVMTLPPRAPLEPCRLAHCHIERSTKLTGEDSGGGGGGSGGGGSGGGRWNNHACSACARVINSGAERLWTTRWGAMVQS